MKPKIRTLPEKVLGVTHGYRFALDLPRFGSLVSSHLFCDQEQALKGAERWLKKVMTPSDDQMLARCLRNVNQLGPLERSFLGLVLDLSADGTELTDRQRLKLRRIWSNL